MPDRTTTSRTRLIAAAGVAALAAWAHLPTIEFLVGKWADDPSYSHGFLVPLFCLYLLWRTGTANLLGGRPAPVAGGLVLALAVAARWLAGKLLFHQLDALALVATLGGLVLAAGGWRMLRGAGPALLFLLFAIPLPYELERNVGGPLKAFATQASTFLLQTLGYPAVAEGNLILIDDVTLGVVDACSGLKMLITFAAFAAGAVLLLDRTKTEKLFIVLGVVPIAVAANVLRVTATGVTYTLTTNADVRHLCHDVYGWLMMPLGLGLLAAQLWALGRLVIPPVPAAAGPGFVYPAAARPAFAAV